MTGIVETVGALQRRLQAVRDLHVMRVEAVDNVGSIGSGWRQLCRECRQAYPCPTREAVDRDD